MPRCKNGTRRNKKTGLCTAKRSSSSLGRTRNARMKMFRTPTKKRCPKGSYKNKKTGNCAVRYRLSQVD